MTMPKKKIKRDLRWKAEHMRRALKKILLICTTDTRRNELADLVQIANLSEQGLTGDRLVGEPNP